MKCFYKNLWYLSFQKLGITVLALFWAMQGLNGQVSNYSFSQSSGAFNSIAGTGTLVAGSEATTSTTNDTSGWSVTIPFSFNFNNIDYTSVYVNSDGGAIFGTTTSTSTTVISTSSAYSGAVAVMNRDLWGVFITSGVTTNGSNVITNVASFKGIEIGKKLNNVNGIPSNTTVTAFDEAAGTITMSAAATLSSSSAVVRYGTGKIFTETIGVAPNRVFVIEWIGYNDYNTSTSGSNYLNFQMRLAESTNTVSLIYGPHYNVNTTVRTNQIGLRGATNSDFNNRSGGSTTTWDNTTAGVTNSASVSRNNTNFPASGLTFTWAPPSPCSGTPTAGTVAPVSQTLAAGQTPETLSLTGFSSGVSGLAFQWQESPDNTTWTNVTTGTGANTPNYSPAAFSGTMIYYRCAVTCTGSSLSENSNSVVLNPCGQVSDFTQNFDSLTPTALPACWFKVGTTGSANTQASTAISGPNNLYIYSSSSTNIAMVAMQPLNTLQSGSYRLKFKARANFTAGGIIEVGYLTNPADQATFTSLGSFTTTSTTVADNFTLNNITAPAGIATLAFRHTGSPANSVLIDDVVYELMPTCIQPTDVTINNATVTSNGANVSWTAPTTAPSNGYEVYYSTSSVAPNSNTVLDNTNSVTSATTSVSLSGLSSATKYYVWVRSACIGADRSIWSASSSFVTLCQTPVILSTSGETVCPGNTATLSATTEAGNTVNWYSDSTGGSSLATGNSFTTPVLTSTTSYWTAASTASLKSAGFTDAVSTSGYTMEAGLFFNAITDFKLEGVYVYPVGNGAGTVTIALQDGSVSPATTIQSVTVNLTGSPTPVKTFVPLNFTIAPGNNYKLMMMTRTGGVSELIRESGASWGTYPLVLPGVLSITNGNCCSGNTTSSSYYYFYDWVVKTKCESVRQEVIATVDSAGCLNTLEAEGKDKLSVSPNPFTDVLNISDISNVKSVSVMDIAGRLVKTIEKPSSALHLSELNSGMYLVVLHLNDGSQQTIKAIKK